MENVKKLMAGFSKIVLSKPDPVSMWKSSKAVHGKTKYNMDFRVLTKTISDLKKVGKPMGVTINDILLCALSHTICRFEEKETGKGPAHKHLAAIWIALKAIWKAYLPPTKDNPLQFGNHNLSCAQVYLPNTDPKMTRKERLELLK
eukprot:UN27194